MEIGEGMIINLVQIFLILSLLQSCVSDKLLDVGKTYRKSLHFEVNGESAKGTHTAKKKNSYHFEISTPQKPNIIKITSCHQERIYVKTGKELSFDYKPHPDIEANNLPCLVEISALEESGKNQWGLIDFQLDTEKLPARVSCNGDIANTKGSYICQSREGLIQEIEFDHDVRVLSPEGCNKITPDQGKKFFYQTTEGSCFYLFSDPKGEMYKLVTFGYNEIIIDE